MTTTKRVRWNCPNDKHPGVLGPSRPPRDSIVRYCLACTQETGRLVERVAPALESKRVAAAATSAAKAKAKRAREAKARERAKQAEIERHTVEDVDLRDEMKKLLKLKAWRVRYPRGLGKMPELVISRRSRAPRSRLGYAEPWRHRITVATYPGQTLADARETLVHELTHLAVGNLPNEGWHGPTFTKTMTAAFKEAYKVLPVGVREGSYHGRYAAALVRKEQGI